MTPQTIEALGRHIRAQTTQKDGGTLTILVTACESGRVLSDLQALVPNSRINGLFENDSDFLLAERYLKNSPSAQALTRDSINLFLKSHRKFDVAVGLSPIDGQSVAPFLQTMRKILKSGGLLIAFSGSSFAKVQFGAAAQREGFDLLYSDLGELILLKALDT